MKHHKKLKFLRFILAFNINSMYCLLLALYYWWKQQIHSYYVRLQLLLVFRLHRRIIQNKLCPNNYSVNRCANRTRATAIRTTQFTYRSGSQLGVREGRGLLGVRTPLIIQKTIHQMVQKWFFLPDGVRVSKWIENRWRTANFVVCSC